MASKCYTIKELASFTQCEIIGNENHKIFGINSLEAATSDEASFLANERYNEALKNSQAGVICINQSGPIIKGKNYLVSANPSRAFQTIAELLLSDIPSAFTGIHQTAVIHSSAIIGKNVNVGPYVVIDQKAIIKDNCTIYANTYIGPNVKIGNDCVIYSNVTIRENSKIGNKVIIQPGAVIGSCGFGFLADEQGKYHKLNQIGNVVIEDEVEIGANTTIDRARFDKTLIRKGTKIDNLVQIAHNVQIGENTAVAAQSGISGSSKLGNNVVLAGQVGVAGHLNLSDKVMVGAQSGISKNLPSGKYRGTPAQPISEWNREHVYVRKLSEYFDKIKELENRIDALEKL
jgi:UDP-3-O-[3-hydroxymyristoyl] glucosamine N-acyltransferase